MADDSGVRRGIRHHPVLKSTLPRLSAFALEHLLLLPLGALLALIWVNLEPESYYRFSFAVAFPVNDIGMAIFFAVITKEVVEATAPGGVLHPWRRALLPVITAIGATALPAVIHIRAVEALDEPMLEMGWPITMVTDLALSYFFARLIFGKHPVIPFLLLLGIASDAFGFVALAIFHSTDELRSGEGATLLAFAIALAIGFRRGRLRSFWPYLLGPGVLCWLAFYRNGMHPAVALVPIMPFLPHAARDPGFFVDASPNDKDTLSQFELFWRYPAQVALFFFGLANAGVPFGALEAGTWGLPIAVLVGKPLGVLAGAGVALMVGLHLPDRVAWRELLISGFLAAIGFTMALFFTAAIVAPGQLRSELSMGALVSVVAGPLAIGVARLLRTGRSDANTARYV